MYRVFGNTYIPTDNKDTVMEDRLPPGLYRMKQDPFKNWFFQKSNSLTIPSKIYGDVNTQASRILKTFNDRNKNTGVLLAGEKGSGKTLLCKKLSLDLEKMNVPTILIDEGHDDPGFIGALAKLQQPTCWFFDEFDKIYPEESYQNALLPLFDGISTSKALILLTVNNKYKINNFLRNRPGRIYYKYEYGSVEKEFIKEYVDDNYRGSLDLTKEIENFKQFFYSLNFDLLSAIVEECNRFDCSVKEALKYLNVSYDISRQNYRIISIRKINTEKEIVDKYKVDRLVYTDFEQDNININPKKNVAKTYTEIYEYIPDCDVQRLDGRVIVTSDEYVITFKPETLY
jgi:hypothetical protein